MQILGRSQSEFNSLAFVVLQTPHALDTLTAQQGEACAIIGEECCFYVNQVGHTASNLSLLKGKINIFHQIKKAKTLYWTDLFPEIGDWFNGVCENSIQFLLFCLLILL